MFVNGCHIVTTISWESPDGLSSVVIRTRGDGETSEKIEKGPFLVMLDAVTYAHSWNDYDNPPPMTGGGHSPNE